MLVLLAVLALGLSAGALVAEGAVLVPFWRSLQPESFLAWYRQHATLLLRFFGPLEIVAASLAVVAALVSWLGDEPASGLLAISAVLAVLVLAMFPLYFQRANASFAGATIATTEVGVELRRWSIWHWVRVVLAIAAFAVAVVAARKGHDRMTYLKRLQQAHRIEVNGEATYVARPILDSYHTVWFEYHEELIGLLGLSRAEEAGTVTHSLMPATASSASGPPSRNARVLCGMSAAASSAPRLTPRRVRDAARLVWRSAMRSPCRTPSRGVWPVVEKRTSFMGDGPPGGMCRRL